MTSLQLQIQIRKVATFARLTALLTRSSQELENPLASRGDAAVVMRIIQTRALPELARIETDIPEAGAARRMVATLLLDVLCLGGSRVTEQAGATLTEWWTSSKKWKASTLR